MKFEIKNRWTGNVQFTAEIEADDQTPVSIKIGMAVKWALSAGAYLTGADLTGAYLARADLTGAYLTGANLTGANLMGADLARADLANANLMGANLMGATGVNPYACTPLLMLLDQPGKIRAYKLVNQKNEGIFNGGLEYKVGESVSVKNADIDPNKLCGAGINVASLDWCIKEWHAGYRVLLVEFEAADIACIPTATDGKFRLHRCDVIGEVDLTKIGLVSGESPESAPAQPASEVRAGEA